MTLKEDLHCLVEELHENDLVTERQLLESLAQRPSGKDSLLEFLEGCQEDDEPTTEDDLAAAVRGREAAIRGELVPHERVAGGPTGSKAWDARSRGGMQQPKSSIVSHWPSRKA